MRPHGDLRQRLQGPGPGAREAELTAAGTLTVRPRFNRFAIRIMRRYRRPRIRIELGALRENGSFWSEPRDWTRTVIVR